LGLAAKPITDLNIILHRSEQIMKYLFNSALLVLLSIVSAIACAEARIFRAADIGFLPGASQTIHRDFNDDGTVVGLSGDESFIWDETRGLRVLPRPTPDAKFSVRAINDIGDMAGNLFYGGSRPDKPIFIRSSDDFSLFLDGTWADYPNTQYIAQVTDSGKILGQSFYVAGSASSRSWIWSKETGLINLPGDTGLDFYAYRMNDHDQVVGERPNPIGCPGSRAFLYNVLTRTALMLDRGPRNPYRPWCGWNSSANAINNAGQVVGYSNTAIGPDEVPVRAFIWTAADGPQPLSGNDDPRKRNTKAEDINEAGQVVGTFEYQGASKEMFFYWDKDNGVINLQEMLDPNDPLTADVILQSNGYRPQINNHGQIVISGRLRGDSKSAGRTFVLTPLVD
jgi:probable HAF family extracellular repeat protein